MAKHVEVHETVKQLLIALQHDSKSEGVKGFLIGRQDDDERVRIVSCCRCQSVEEQTVRQTVQQLQHWLPGGVAVCGILYSSILEPSTETVKQESQKYKTLLKHVTVEEPVLCHLQKDSKVTIDNFFLLTSDWTPVKSDVHTTDCNILQECLIARARCKLNISFKAASSDWKTSLHERLTRLSEELMSQSTVFYLPGTSVLLGMEGCSGVTSDTSCRDLYWQTQEERETGVVRKKKNDKTQCSLTFAVYTDVTSDCSRQRTPSCAPVINHNTEKMKKVSLVLPVDVVAIVSLESTVTELAEVLCNALAAQMAAMETSISQHHKGEKFYTPEPYHYQPVGLQTIFTVLHPHGLTEEQLVSHRKSLQQSLCLPTDRPLFRRVNRFMFPEERNSQGYLVNVHEGLPPSKVKEGRQYIVDGFYTYHHYMQDRFDDNKWGCAYRSLQTLVSWFNLQGYSQVNIPTHRQIQQALVDMGDKETNFIGSRKWIGSMEVSFVLDHLIGVTSKILSVSSGADIASKGRELASHFTTQGTPIMIGGGVLAHTILGVDYDEVSGDINFLILDPHYTGAEDLKTIQDKGWCGWKDADFWEKGAHYNMCMPQRPNVI